MSMERARELIEKNLPVGTELQNGGSVVTEHKANGSAVITRRATGSVVAVSARMVASTLQRLERGEYLGKRSISGTTSIEAGVAAAAGLSWNGNRWLP